MNKRQYNTLIDALKTLPVPGTILYPPADKVEGCLLLQWEIDDEGLRARMQFSEHCEGCWRPEQVRMCTWKD